MTTSQFLTLLASALFAVASLAQRQTVVHFGWAGATTLSIALFLQWNGN